MNSTEQRPTLRINRASSQRNKSKSQVNQKKVSGLSAHEKYIKDCIDGEKQVRIYFSSGLMEYGYKIVAFDKFSIICRQLDVVANDIVFFKHDIRAIQVVGE